MGAVLGWFVRRRWFTTVGFVAILLGAIPPWPHAIQTAALAIGVLLILVQIPLTIRRETRARRATQRPPDSD